MPSPTRFYLRTNHTEYRPLAWFQNNKVNEMLLGIYGLNTKQAILKYMLKEKEVTTEELKRIRYEYRDAEEVGLKIDHITCHADGKFHVKTKEHKDLYVHEMKRVEALGPDTSTFLDISLISDIASNYSVNKGKLKYPHTWFDLDGEQYISFRGIFSGMNHDLRTEMANSLKEMPGPHGGIELTSGSLKGLLVGKPGSLSEAARQARIPGTILSFNFPIGKDLWHVKTFMFQ